MTRRTATHTHCSTHALQHTHTQHTHTATHTHSNEVCAANDGSNVCVCVCVCACHVKNSSPEPLLSFPPCLLRLLLLPMWNSGNESRMHYVTYRVAKMHRIGCLKVQVSFRKTAFNHRALLRKMTHKDKASYGSWSRCRMRLLWGAPLLIVFPQSKSLLLSR